MVLILFIVKVGDYETLYHVVFILSVLCLSGVVILYSACLKITMALVLNVSAFPAPSVGVCAIITFDDPCVDVTVGMVAVFTPIYLTNIAGCLRGDITILHVATDVNVFWYEQPM